MLHNIKQEEGLGQGQRLTLVVAFDLAYQAYKIKLQKSFKLSQSLQLYKNDI